MLEAVNAAPHIGQLNPIFRKTVSQSSASGNVLFIAFKAIRLKVCQWLLLYGVSFSLHLILPICPHAHFTGVYVVKAMLKCTKNV